MTIEMRALTLIRTKMQRPQLPGDLVPRRRLLDRLCAGSSRKLTLISAQAGAGKTTLMAQWLADAECPQPSAWLSLDEHDNDLVVFVSYLIGAVRTVFPGACEKTLGLLSAAQPPPLRVITTSLVNALDDLAVAPSKEGDPLQNGARSPSGLIVALDDYQTITEPVIHELMSDLIQHLPQGVHLARSHVPEARFLKMDMRRLQFDDGRFDGICAFYSLFHVPREEHLQVLIKFNRLLRQDGVLIFSTGKSAWQATEEFHGTRMFWSHPDHEVTRQWVIDAGFAVMMSEVRELGGEEHYWVMARKST